MNNGLPRFQLELNIKDFAYPVTSSLVNIHLSHNIHDETQCIKNHKMEEQDSSTSG